MRELVLLQFPDELEYATVPCPRGMEIRVIGLDIATTMTDIGEVVVDYIHQDVRVTGVSSGALGMAVEFVVGGIGLSFNGGLVPQGQNMVSGDYTYMLFPTVANVPLPDIWFNSDIRLNVSFANIDFTHIWVLYEKRAIEPSRA